MGVMLWVVVVLAVAGQGLCGLRVDAEASVVRDEWGRARVMHGVNVVFKEFPYLPSRSGFDSNSSLVAEDFHNLRSWGFNSIRLYLAWEGFEPQRLHYNFTYLEELRKIVREASDYGISVVLNAHHDLYSKKFCGEGFPTWLGQSHSFPAPFRVALRRDDQGLPLKQDCLKMAFQKYYLSYDVVSFSQDFFHNKGGMQDMFIEMWTRVAGFFKDEPNVVGYDLLNEPASGNLYFNPYSFIGPGAENNHLLLPFYRKLSKAIRTVDKQKLLMFEVAPQDLVGGFFEPFSPDSSHDLLNFHTYCPLAKQIGRPRCDSFNRLYTNNRQRNIRKLGLAGIVTEFGSVPNTPAGRAEINSVTNHTDRLLISWYYWQFKYNMDSTCSTNPPWLHAFYYPDGSLQREKVLALSYPYAYAICGRLISQEHSRGSYSLSYSPSDCGGKFTQIFANSAEDFPRGFVVKFSPSCPECRLRLSSQPDRFEVVVPAEFRGRPFTVQLGAKLQQSPPDIQTQ